MSKLAFTVAGLSAAVLSGSALAGTTSFDPVNNAVNNRNDVLIPNSLQPLDLSSRFGLAVGGVDNNEFTANYVGQAGNFSGTLKLEVFANVGVPGPSVNDVLLVYSFLGNGGTPFGAESFHFGIDSSKELDYASLASATHGRVNNETTNGDPLVRLFSNTLSNDTWLFDYDSDELGGANAESYVWYVRTNGAIALDFVNVVITDFGFTEILFPAPAITTDQPDLNFPSPGVLGVLAPAGLLAMRRRRA